MGSDALHHRSACLQTSLGILPSYRHREARSVAHLWDESRYVLLGHSEIPGVSPLIQQFLQNLNIWQDALRRTLETFNVPPDNYLPLGGSGSVDEPANILPIHRFRTILDPNNTPFS